MAVAGARICKKCSGEFPSSMVIDGKRRSFTSRSYCLECSPFKSKNTKKLHEKKNESRLCETCGETDASKFYGHKKSVCGKCHNKYTMELGQRKREWAIEQLGGECKACGYDSYLPALDIHHTDPSLKDPSFASMRGWSKERIAKEIESCICLCSNCHRALHSGFEVFMHKATRRNQARVLV